MVMLVFSKYVLVLLPLLIWYGLWGRRDSYIKRHRRCEQALFPIRARIDMSPAEAKPKRATLWYVIRQTFFSPTLEVVVQRHHFAPLQIVTLRTHNVQLAQALRNIVKNAKPSRAGGLHGQVVQQASKPQRRPRAKQPAAASRAGQVSHGGARETT